MTTPHLNQESKVQNRVCTGIHTVAFDVIVVSSGSGQVQVLHTDTDRDREREGKERKVRVATAHCSSFTASLPHTAAIGTFSLLPDTSHQSLGCPQTRAGTYWLNTHSHTHIHTPQ